jgi:hypothetical protein
MSVVLVLVGLALLFLLARGIADAVRDVRARRTR